MGDLVALLSNSALCLLKLKWPDRAKRSTTQALVVVQKSEDATIDQSKLFYRRGLACEMLEQYELAVDDMTRAFKEEKRVGLEPSEQHRLRAEVDRMQKRKAQHQEWHKH